MSPEERLVLVVAILIIALIALYVELKFIRGRGVSKKFASSRVGKDQAFNSLHTTKAVKNRFRAEGYSTEKVDLMLMRADSAFGSRDYQTCIDICERAREELYRCRQTVPASDVSDESPRTAREEYPRFDGEPEEFEEHEKPEEPSRPSDANLRLQSNFELKAARGDLEQFDGPAERRERASEMIAEAERLYETGDYQRSLSTSFKARKLLAGELEGGLVEAAAVDDAAAQEPGSTKAPAKCSRCGEPVVPGDRFCGQCGEAVAERRCRSCDSPLLGQDRFCRKCGTKS